MPPKVTQTQKPPQISRARGAPEAQPQSAAALPIEDYALIGDCATAALVGRNGAIDWLCLPRFDSSACFASLLGDRNNGTWRIAPAADSALATRRYRGDTMVLETEFETAHGRALVIDFMPVRARGSPAGGSAIVRLVRGLAGHVPMQLHLALRFDYGSTVPWVTRLADNTHGLSAIAGPDLVVLRTPVKLHGRDMTTQAEFTIAEGETIPFVLQHGPSHLPAPAAIDAEAALAATDAYWRDWSARCRYQGPWRDPVLRSLMTLKALTFETTGGIAAAPTTSLPEQLGGQRNWDYRFCWLRDTTLTLMALMQAGYYDEARDWRDWLHRAIAGDPAQIQIMYGLAGERRLDEWEVPWLGGYQGAKPVRIGNAAAGQLQLDVYGEVVDALHQARVGGIASAPASWALQGKLMAHLEAIWREPDEGIWEVRGGRRHFTFSKVMAWVAFDRSVKGVEQFGLHGPVDRWRAVRDEIHATVCREGFDAADGHFVQSFGSHELDASLLLIPLVGFLPHEDERVRGTVDAIARDLVSDGFVLRYRTTAGTDGLPPGEGAFLACSFWLADCLHMQGRRDEARAI
ncbi:MAG TPA: glycoside hydrolase family 15 protein, partial [Acetobacteraceae bacterium]|nr:glycoside hydrolase family 15 protein [Acetobacteraceae bacterium]